MKKSALVLSTLFSLLAFDQVSAGQGDYQTEITFGHITEDATSSDNEKSDTTVTVFGFEYFIKPVEVNNQPLAEAWFMNRVSSFSMAIANMDYENDSRTGDINSTAFGYTHLQPDSDLIAQVQYMKQDASYTFKPGHAFIDYSYDRTLTGILVGAFVKQNTSVVVEYIKDDVTYSPTAYAGNNFTRTTTNVSAKHLMPMGGETTLNIEALLGSDSYDESTEADTKNSVLELSADYYLNHKQSVGATYKSVSGDDNYYKGTSIAFNAHIFFTPKASLLAEFRQFSGEGKSDDEDTLSLYASMRF